MLPRVPLRTVSALLCAVLCDRSALAAELSERDYFSELPVVLSASRLAQPLNETPGAVTVIDRDTIRRSGARELADVLRLVPGYMVGGSNGANPVAAYHAPLDMMGIRNLVLIDGRSVYSAYYLGDTHLGTMGVLLDDIERIEVLRGANGSAYGANAMFGVINIITRHAEDTRGLGVAITAGEGGIADYSARAGWGDDRASFRLSAGSRSDSGYLNAYDDKKIGQLHFRADLRPSADQDAMLAAGVADLAAGTGFAGRAGSPERTYHWHDVYVHGSWQRQLSPTDQIKLSASYDEETIRDHFIYPLDAAVRIDFGGQGRRLNLEFQHQVGLGPNTRAVWGVGHKHEEAVSPPLYNQKDAVAVRENRLFGNIEWRPAERWIINAGGYWGESSRKGGYFSPKLTANYSPAQDHNLRFGYTSSKRMPSLFELAADVRYYPKSLASWPPTASNLLPLFAYLGMPAIYTKASGNVGPEQLSTYEIGYLGNFRDLRLTLDVRAYREKMRDIISDKQNGTVPGYVFPISLPPYFKAGDPIPVTDSVNAGGFKTDGVEYQLRYKPFASTEIWLNQNFQRLTWDDGVYRFMPPSRSTTLALFQKLPHDLDLSVMYHVLGAMTWNNRSDRMDAYRRLDLRLAWPFRIGAQRVEAALTVQAANGDYSESKPSQGYLFERRAYGTLRIEY